MRILRINTATNLVVNVEEWASLPNNTAEHTFIDAPANVGIGFTYTGSGFTEPAPVPVPVPDEPTLSDWRVALLLLGKFDDVKTAVDAANAAGTIEGKIAFERFEYANHVYRDELLQLVSVFGFSEADVDASLRKAAEVSRGILTPGPPAD
jgi:hypothetical protein